MLVKCLEDWPQIATRNSPVGQHWDVVGVKWSACLPSTPTIRVRIPLKPNIFSIILCLKRTKINQKEAGVGPLSKKTLGLQPDQQGVIRGRFAEK